MRFGNKKSEYIINNPKSGGRSVYLGCYDYPNGAVFVAVYKGDLYKITHDGTGNEFFCSHAPEEINENECLELLAKGTASYEEFQEGMKTLGIDRDIPEDEYVEILVSEGKAQIGRWG